MVGHAELAVALGFLDGAAELESIARHADILDLPGRRPGFLLSPANGLYSELTRQADA
jgi:hypothetical protein